MDRTRTSDTACASDLPAAAGSDPAKRTVRGDVPAAEPDGGCFDCNICLDAAADPVVTLCGHLYCWPCIYEWLRPDAETEGESRSSARRQCCPVCKAAVTPDTLVPLFGRGSSSRPKKPPTSIPRRPALRLSAQEGDHHHHPSVQTDRHQADAAQFDFLFPPPYGYRSMMHSTAGGVLGGMAMVVLPWVIRGQEQPPSMSFPSRSQRRRYTEVERSLHQLWYFLFVFVLLCWLLF